ncbi:MAG: hypothetical protein WBB65_04180 [Anaerolineales bacterium]
MFSKPNTPDESSPCPICGEPMHAGTHDVHACLQRSNEQEVGLNSIEAELSSAPSSKDDSRSRFRKILADERRTRGDSPPGWMIDELPEEARRLLSQQVSTARPSLGPRLSEDLAKALRDQGYVIHEDSQGVHLGGALVSRGGTPAPISPYDVVRLAAETEGGLTPPDELARCKKCDALIPAGDERCQWCAEPAA